MDIYLQSYTRNNNGIFTNSHIPGIFTNSRIPEIIMEYLLTVIYQEQ